VTNPICTLIDLAAMLTERQLERAVNEADSLGLVTPEKLRRALAGRAQPGAAKLRRLLDRQMFVMTDSDLEQRFLPLVAAAGLRRPQTREVVNSFRVDFFWPELGLVVETDSWRHHRTPAHQDRDRRRDQAHLVAGLAPLRFTHGQIAFEPDYVVATPTAVARRLGH
jgi:very-short-patch-repair endonuclease